MNRKIIIAFLIFCSVFTLAQSANAGVWTDLVKGMAYQKLNLPVRSREVTLHAFKINPKHLRIRPVFADTNATARKMAERNDALLLVNANFFDTSSKALGLVVTDWQVKNPVRDISWWGIFCLNRKKARILHTREYRSRECQQAVQAGPRLVINGSIPKLKDESSRKTAVGITPKGEVIIVMSEQRLPIKELAAVFQKTEAQGGFGCPHALNLDGGSSSQLYAKVEGFTLNVPSYVNFPVGLGVFRK